MSFRFLHCSDLHIGAGRRLLPDTGNALADVSYLFRYASMLYQIEFVAEQENVEVVLIAGDLFHTKAVAMLEMELVRSWLTRMGKKFRVLIVDGQHDAIKTITDVPFRYTLLRHIPLAAATGIPGVTLADSTSKMVTWKGVNFLLLPFGYPLDQLPKIPDRCVIVHHVTVLGSISESGHRMRSGNELPAKKKVVYWALGDIHRKQRIKGLPAWYAGSPIQHRFGDPPNTGVYVVDSRDFQPRFVPIPSRKLVTVSSVQEAKKTDDIARIKTKEALDPNEVLPENVSKVDLKVPEGVKNFRAGKGMWKNIRKELRALGVNKKQRQWAVKELDTIIRDLNLSKGI